MYLRMEQTRSSIHGLKERDNLNSFTQSREIRKSLESRQYLYEFKLSPVLLNEHEVNM